MYDICSIWKEIQVKIPTDYFSLQYCLYEGCCHDVSLNPVSVFVMEYHDSSNIKFRSYITHIINYVKDDVTALFSQKKNTRDVAFIAMIDEILNSRKPLDLYDRKWCKGLWRTGPSFLWIHTSDMVHLILCYHLNCWTEIDTHEHFVALKFENRYINDILCKRWFNSSPPSAAYMRQWIRTLVQIMACRLFGAKPLPEPMLVYCQLDS